MIEYADFECPYCAALSVRLRGLRAARSSSATSRCARATRAPGPAACAAEAAGAPGPLLGDARLAVRRPGRGSRTRTCGSGRARLGLDLERFDADRRSDGGARAGQARLPLGRARRGGDDADACSAWRDVRRPSSVDGWPRWSAASGRGRALVGRCAAGCRRRRARRSRSSSVGGAPAQRALRARRRRSPRGRGRAGAGSRSGSTCWNERRASHTPLTIIITSTRADVGAHRAGVLGARHQRVEHAEQLACGPARISSLASHVVGDRVEQRPVGLLAPDRLLDELEQRLAGIGRLQRRLAAADRLVHPLDDDRGDQVLLGGEVAKQRPAAHAGPLRRSRRRRRRARARRTSRVAASSSRRRLRSASARMVRRSSPSMPDSRSIGIVER